MDKFRILLVEDIYFSQVLFESILLQWGYEVIIASDGSKALEYLEGNNVDLIILDLMMPVMDGFRFLEEKKSKGNTTPTLVLSARSDLESVNKALKLGANDYITKPLNATDLENKIKVFQKL